MNINTPRHACAVGMGFALTALATASAVHAQTRVIYADAHAPAGGNGASWGTAFRDLQDALTSANADPSRLLRGIEVRIAQGIYPPDRATGNRTMAFSPMSAVSLLGGFAGLIGADPDERDPNRFVSVLSGDLARNDGPNFTNYEDNAQTILDLNFANPCSVDGLTIRASARIATPTTFFGVGGAITANRQVSENSARFGIVVLNRCVIEDNLSILGGPVVSGGNVLLNACRISNNRTVDAPIIYGSQQLLTRCQFRGNRVSSSPTIPIGYGLVGGAGLISPPRFQTCLFSDNFCDGPGMIPCVGYTFTEAFNCTFVANPTTPRPAFWLQSGSRLRLRNCIFAPGALPPYPALFSHIVASQGWDLDIDRSNLLSNGAAGIDVPVGTFDPAGVLAGDPMFVSPTGQDRDPATWRDNDYRLRPGSPAIDSANTFDPVFAQNYWDLDGVFLHDDTAAFNRGIGIVAYADLGCYEYQGQLCPADFNASGTLSPQDIFDFLSAWFAADSRADFNGGGLSPLDIFDFINAWLTGC